MEKKASIYGIFMAFFRVSLFAIGGGTTMAPFMIDELVKRKPWTDEETILNNFALAQSIPGIIAVNSATLIGYKLRKVKGAVAGFLGMITPPFVIIILISQAYQSFSQNQYVQGALFGMRIAVLALLVTSTWNLFKKSIEGLTGLMLAAIAFIALLFMDIPAVFVIFGGMLLSLVIYGRKAETDGNTD